MTTDHRRHLMVTLASSDDVVVTTTCDGVIASWSRGAERAFGYAAAEAVGRAMTILWPEERLHEEAAPLARVCRGERVDPFDTVYIRKDGSRVDVSVALSPLRDGDGRVVGVSGIARDITAARRAEVRLRAYDTLLAGMGDAVVTTDDAGRVTFLNSVAESLTGWTAAEALGRPIDEVVRLHDARTGDRRETPAALVAGERRVGERANDSVLVARDGRRRPVDDTGAAILDDEQRLLGAVIVFRDAAERRRIEHGLQRLAAIVESSDDAIVSKTLDGRITSWNRGAQRMFGYTEDEMLGHSITRIFPADRLAEEDEFLRRIARGERVEHFETVRMRKDGRHIDVSVTLSPVRDKAGAIVGVSKIARDISERVTLAMRERAALREAEAANRFKDEFLATLSHELRTPLTAVLGWIRIIRTGDLGRAALERGLEVADRNCQALLEMVRDLLDLSTIRRGQVRLAFEDLDLGAIVRDAVDSLRPTADAKGVTMAVALARVGVRGDAQRLQQVMWNLLSNAVKFTPRGRNVEVAVTHGDGVATITVRDTGVGIPAEALSHIFEPFRQADSSTTRRFGGLGLGLSVVRHFLELHGGTVEAQSDGPDQGATFVVRLPLRGDQG